jgi:hypothetical protein
VKPCRKEDKQGPHLLPFTPQNVIQDNIEQGNVAPHRSAEVRFKISHLLFNRFPDSGQVRHEVNIYSKDTKIALNSNPEDFGFRIYDIRNF